VQNNQTSVRIGNIPSANAVASYSGGASAIVFDYRGTTFFKTYTAIGGITHNTGSNQSLFGGKGGLWRSTAAITSVKVLLSAGNFVNGSVVSLYGHM
jgi:hypothetical protein